MGDSLSGLSLDSITGAYSKYSGTTTNTEEEVDTSYMDFDSYLKLLVAQMSNQDFNDPMSDSEVLQQMASYSMLEGIKNMTSQSNISYATSLVGQAVTVNNGTDYDTGVVVSVIVKDGSPYLVVNGEQYKVDKVSDVTSASIYNTLASLIGHTVEAKGQDEDGNITTVTGKVTNVLILEGSGYVVIDEQNLYALSDVSVVAEEGSDTEGDTEGDTENTTEEGSEAVAATMASLMAGPKEASYTSQSAVLFDELMSTIDAISNSSTASNDEEKITDIPGYENASVSFDAPDYAAGVFAESNEVLQTLSVNSDQTLGTNSVLYAQLNSLQSSGIRAGNFDMLLNSYNVDQVISSEKDGRISAILDNNQVRNILLSNEYQTRYSTKYGLEVKSDIKPGISTADCEPHRIYADQYPEEAALADALGTRMYDIRFIHNTAITSRINTSEVIGVSMTGREVTELGYSGKGQLGEVVTFKDGTQRVEILLKNGTSSWINTSGNLTLDEICNVDNLLAPRAIELTPLEKAIRNYSM